MPDFQEDTLCLQDISILESIDTSEKTTTSIAHEEQDAFVTAIIPGQVTPDNVVEATPLQTVPTRIRSLFVNLIEDWVQESIVRNDLVRDSISINNVGPDEISDLFCPHFS